MVAFEAGDVCGDFEAGVAEVFVEFVVSCAAGPFENSFGCFGDELIGVLL